MAKEPGLASGRVPNPAEQDFLSRILDNFGIKFEIRAFPDQHKCIGRSAMIAKMATASGDRQRSPAWRRLSNKRFAGEARILPECVVGTERRKFQIELPRRNLLSTSETSKMKFRLDWVRLDSRESATWGIPQRNPEIVDVEV